MKKIILLAFVFAVFSTSVFAAPVRNIRNPDAYAEQATIQSGRAESDTGRFEFGGCQRVGSPDPKYVRVRCVGKTQVLMFSGHPISSNYSCVSVFALDRNTGTYTGVAFHCASK